MNVSIVITNYNYSKWLNRCIRSCINQNFQNYEIIIVDDASTDNSYKILNQHQDNNQIKIIHNAVNVGIGGAAFIGLQKALGRYIVRIDADDYVNENFLTCLYMWASTNKSHAVACDYYTVDFNETLLSKENAKDNPIACGILFRTDILEYLGNYNPAKKIQEETDLMNRFNKEFNLEYLHIPLYRYFKHEGSLSS